MESNNKNHKKNKNYYKYHNNHNNNKQYNKNNHNNKKFYYYKNKKKHQKQDNVVENKEQQLNQQSNNILLDNVEQNNQIQQESQQQYQQQRIQQVLQENTSDYEELEFHPIKKKEKEEIPTKSNFLKYAVVFVLLVGLVFGVSYSFFTYEKDDSRQGDISSGEVYVTLQEQAVTMTLNRMYPRTAEEARARNDNYIDFTVKAKNTSPTKELNYVINISNGDAVVGKTRINPQYLVVDLQEKVNGDYTYIKNAVTLNNFSFDDVIPVNTTSEITKEYRLRIWVSDAIIISDTESNASYTQQEFNNLYANVNVEINAVDRAPLPPICKRATQLHTEKCVNNFSSGSYCWADGYTVDVDYIEYGNLGTSGAMPSVGDAFDCDVNGDGNYSERFYYISPHYNTDTQTFDDETGYATLVYYNIVANGTAYYASGNENWHGPVTAVTNLPTTAQWSNISLKEAERTISACDNSNCSNTPVLTTTNGTNTIENPFDYSNYAARLLTLQELNQSGCDTLSGKSSLGTTGSLKACKFLFEQTKYADNSKTTSGLWVETPNAGNMNYVYYLDGGYRNVSGHNTSLSTSEIGVKPVIDVPYSKIEY